MTEQHLCKCGRGPVMPSSTGGGRQYGNCSKCHYERIKRYRATPAGKASTQATKERYRSKLKTDTLAAYGGLCSCCGEAEPTFLTIDHVNDDGGGRNRKKSGQSLYSELRRLGYPKEGYRLLCFNCNTGRHINGGTCPHEAMEATQ